MKKIPISISMLKNEYNIYIAGEFVHFKTKTGANKYLRKLKQLAKETVVFLNHYYTSVYTLYRAYYLDFSRKINSSMQIYFDNFVSDFNRIFEPSNSNWPLKYLKSSFEILLKAIDLLTEQSGKYKFSALTRQLKVFTKIILDQKNALTSNWLTLNKYD